MTDFERVARRAAAAAIPDLPDAAVERALAQVEAQARRSPALARPPRPRTWLVAASIAVVVAGAGTTAVVLRHDSAAHRSSISSTPPACPAPPPPTGNILWSTTAGDVAIDLVRTQRGLALNANGRALKSWDDTESPSDGGIGITKLNAFGNSPDYVVFQRVSSDTGRWVARLEDGETVALQAVGAPGFAGGVAVGTTDSPPAKGTSAVISAGC